MRFRFRPAEKITLKKEIQDIIQAGRRTPGGEFTVCWREHAGSRKVPVRVGIRLARGFSGAVARNRVRRLVREVFRKYKSNLKPGHDLVIIARPFPEAGKAGYFSVEEKITGLFRESGLWLKN